MVGGPTRSCPFCGGAAADAFEVREMMFGLRHRFTYCRCATCGSLWLGEPPEDLGPYYGSEYYSLAGEDPKGALPTPGAVAWLHVLLRLPVPVADAMAGRRGFPTYIKWFSRVGGVRPTARVADVGSGEGDFVYQLSRHGFRDVWGFDPFIEADRDLGAAHLRRADLAEARGTFAIVTFNHSLEHMRDPLGALTCAAGRLSQGGTIIVRVPVAGSFADRHYGSDWVALDAPRHLAIPSRAGMEALAGRAGLRVEATFYDSTPLQFWGSERYRADMALHAEPDPVGAPLRPLQRRARRLNAAGDGDSAGYVLRRT